MPDCNQRKSLDDFKELYLNKLQAKLCPDQELPAYDPLAIAGIVFSGLAFMQDGNMHRRFKSLAFVDEMCCDDLIRIAQQEGIDQGQATSASGCVIVTGNAGAAIPSDFELTGTSNIIYSLDPASANPATIGIDGTATVCVTASEPGVDGNIAAGSVIQTYESYPEIDSDVTVDETGFFGGADVEDCESVRARLKEKRRRIQACGTKEWYIDRVLEYPGVTRVCCASCGCSECGGCCRSGYLIMYPLFEGYENGIAPQGVYDALTEYIFGTTPGDGSGIAPFGAQGEFVRPEVVETTVVIECVDSPTPQQVDAITNAVSAWYNENLCVGDQYCSADLNSVVKQAAPGLCPCRVRITGVGVINTPNDCPETGQIPCGSLPILSGVTFL